MSYNGSGTFQINTSGQPVVAGTVISSTAFNALTADLATGLSTAITKDGQTTTTARIPFAQGISSTLTTDSSSVSTGSIITAGGVGIAKNLYVGANANVAGTLGVTGVATFSAAPIYSSLTASSAVATDASKGLVSVTNTGTGNNVLATSPTLVTPVLGAASATSVTVAAGTVSDPAITTTGDTNTGIFFPAADTIAFAEGGAEAMRIDSSGNVGIGTASPATKLDVNGNIALPNATALQFKDSGGSRKDTLQLNSSSNIILQSPSASIFQINGSTEAMRVDAGGNLLMGATSARTSEAKIELTSAANTALSFYMYKSSQVEMAMGFKSSTDTNFYIGTGSSSVGTNGVYLQNTGSSWIAVSDERFKTELQPIENALSKIANIRAVTGRYIYDEENGKSGRRSFLIAQDFVEALPEAVDQQNPDKLGLSYSDTIPLLYAAIKEQQALITALTARITAQQVSLDSLTARITALEAK